MADGNTDVPSAWGVRVSASSSHEAKARTLVGLPLPPGAGRGSLVRPAVPLPCPIEPGAAGSRGVRGSPRAVIGRSRNRRRTRARFMSADPLQDLGSRASPVEREARFTQRPRGGSRKPKRQPSRASVSGGLCYRGSLLVMSGKVRLGGAVPRMVLKLVFLAAGGSLLCALPLLACVEWLLGFAPPLV